MVWMIRTGSNGHGTGKKSIRWGSVARWGGGVAIPILLLAFVWAVDPWLSLFPREPGRWLMEAFLRSLLVGYATVLVCVPLALIGTIFFLLRARRRGRSRPWLARAALLCGSTMIAAAGVELIATAWLAWVHRMPALPTTFSERPPAEEISLVVLGGSSALGYPYHPELSVGQIVAWQIGQALPTRKVNLDIRARTGVNLEHQHQELATVKRRPDAVIVYSGHNEFLSRFDPQRDAGYAEAPTDGLLLGIYRLSLHSPFCRWVYETVNKHRLGGPPPKINQHRLIDVPTFTPSEYLDVLNDFRRRLEAITGYCERIGAVPILIIPAGNESGFEPNRSLLPDRVSPAERERFAQRMRAARELEASSPQESIREYRALLAEQPRFAESHFRLARLLDRSGAYDEARAHYIQARDLDGFPVRCPSDFAQVYREVAARHDCIFLDGAEVLRGRGRHGILDDGVLHDAQHPTFGSYVTLSQAVMDALYERKVFGLGRDGAKAPAIDPAECLRHFDFDAKDWEMVCLRSELYYNHLRASRFDDLERRAKEDRWHRAGVDLHSRGIPLERLGVPGIGVPAQFPSRVDWWTLPPPSAELQVGGG